MGISAKDAAKSVPELEMILDRLSALQIPGGRGPACRTAPPAPSAARVAAAAGPSIALSGANVVTALSLPAFAA